MKIKCLKCQSGLMKYRLGRLGPFLGCSNYSNSKCRSTMDFDDDLKKLARTLDNGSRIIDAFPIEKKERISFEDEKRQEEYSKLVSLLNKLRSDGKISAVERRNYGKKWRTYPNNRDLLMRELNLKLGK